MLGGLHACEGLELTKESTPPRATERRLRQGTASSGQETARQGVDGLAAEAAGDEGVPDMRQERGAEHQLAEAAPAEGAQAAVAGQRGQRHDHGDPEVDRVAPDQPRREPQPFAEAGQGVR